MKKEMHLSLMNSVHFPSLCYQHLKTAAAQRSIEIDLLLTLMKEPRKLISTRESLEIFLHVRFSKGGGGQLPSL